MTGGMRRGFDHKLLPPYRITKTKDEATIETDLNSPNGPISRGFDDRPPENNDKSQLLPLQEITSYQDYKAAMLSPESEDATPSEQRRRSLEAGEYDRLNSIELDRSRSAGASEDDIAWQLPPTHVPGGDLSPF